MQDYVQQIQSIIEQVREDARAEGREEARGELMSLLGGSNGKAKGKKAKPTKRPKGAKRSPEEMAQLTNKLRAHIAKNAGQRVEEIAAALGTSTKELALPIIKLFEDKAITSKGVRRGTKYYAK